MFKLLSTRLVVQYIIIRIILNSNVLQLPSYSVYYSLRNITLQENAEYVRCEEHQSVYRLPSWSASTKFISLSFFFCVVELAPATSRNSACAMITKALLPSLPKTPLIAAHRLISNCVHCVCFFFSSYNYMVSTHLISVKQIKYWEKWKRNIIIMNHNNSSGGGDSDCLNRDQIQSNRFFFLSFYCIIVSV